MRKIPTLPLIAHVPVDVKMKLVKIAQQREISIKELLLEIIRELPEPSK